MVDLGVAKISLEDVYQVSFLEKKVALSKACLPAIQKSRAFVEARLGKTSQPIYGINTGFGSLKDFAVDVSQVDELQVNLIRSHAVGIGDPLSKPLARAMMFLRAATLRQGYSGVRGEVIELLLKFLNEDITPVIPCLGSVGASGDLAPLSHLALCLMGEGKVFYKGETLQSAVVLKALAITPLSPKAKEALALINGTQMIAAHASLAIIQAEFLLKQATLIGALSLEASLGSAKAFDERVMKLKPHPGQLRAAKILRRVLTDSAIAESHISCKRVQDAYSFRCMPQVHGTGFDGLSQCRRMVDIELNSVTDNPIILSEDEETISSGNFHGQAIAMAMDMIPLSLVPVMSISERRQSRLLNHHLTDLPVALIKNPGLQSGLMMLQVTSAAIVSESKSLAHPASVDSIPTWEDQEDHVSMGAFAGRKAFTVVSYFSHVLANEAMIAAQALEFRRPLKTSPALERVFAWIRSRAPKVENDRDMSQNIADLSSDLLRGDMMTACELNFDEPKEYER